MLLDGCEVFDCEQGSEEWLRARAGIVTASTFSDVMAKGRSKGSVSEQRRKLLFATAAEIITGEPTPHFGGNRHTQRGHALEPVVRSLYEMHTEEDVTTVGFIRRGRIGYSPDACVGMRAGFECKTRLPDLQIALLEADRLPLDHYLQCQGGLLVTGWPWIDYWSYCKGLPVFKKRIERDHATLSELNSELNIFHREVDMLVKKYGRPS